MIMWLGMCLSRVGYFKDCIFCALKEFASFKRPLQLRDKERN